MSLQTLPLKKMTNAIRWLGGDCALRMRIDGSWYVTETRIEIAHNGLLTSPTQSASSPAGAVERWWKQHTDLPEGASLIALRRNPEQQRGWQWNPDLEWWEQDDTSAEVSR